VYFLPPSHYLTRLDDNLRLAQGARSQMMWAVGFSGIYALFGALAYAEELTRGASFLNRGLPYALGGGGFWIALVWGWRRRDRWLELAEKAGQLRPAGPAVLNLLSDPIAKSSRLLMIENHVPVYIDSYGEGSGSPNASAFVARIGGKDSLVLGRSLIALFLRDERLMRGVIGHELAHIAHSDSSVFHDAWHTSRHVLRSALSARKAISWGIMGVLTGEAIVARDILPVIAAPIVAALHGYVFRYWVINRLERAASKFSEASREAEHLADLGGAVAAGPENMAHTIGRLCPASEAPVEPIADLHPPRSERLHHLNTLMQTDLLSDGVTASI
jgi:Zn-dependent protease with chaperone function